MTADLDSPVEWRFASAPSRLAEWERRPDVAWVTVEYRLPDSSSLEWWRVQVVTHSWLHGMLAMPYTAHALPALLIVPDGALTERCAAISRILGRGPALDLTRVAERVLPDERAAPESEQHP